MGDVWNSVLVRTCPHELAAKNLTSVALACRGSAKVRLLCSSWNGLTSLEMLSSRTRPALLRAECAREISRALFGSDGSFSTAEVLLAEAASRTLGGVAVYVHHNDTYNSAGYVAYRDGALSAFDLVGWMGGSKRYRSSNAEEVDIERVLSRGAEYLLTSSMLTVEDLFQRFYEEPDIYSVYVVAEGGYLLDPPRSEP